MFLDAIPIVHFCSPLYFFFLSRLHYFLLLIYFVFKCIMSRFACVVCERQKSDINNLTCHFCKDHLDSFRALEDDFGLNTYYYTTSDYNKKIHD